MQALERQLGRVIPWLFPHLEGRFVGQRLVDVRKIWQRACREAGVPGVLIHDLRRSAVRNMEEAGIPRSVVMKVTGHRTERIYARYAIVSETDMDTATDRIEARRRTRSATSHPIALPLDLSHSTSHSGPAAQTPPRIFASQ